MIHAANNTAVTDVGGVVSVGDEVALLGGQNGEPIRVAEFAERTGLIDYEVMCGISSGAPRL